MTAFQPFDFRDTSCEVMDLYKETVMPNGIVSYQKEATIYRKPNGGKELNLIFVDVRTVENANSLQLFFSFIHYRVSR